MFDAVSNSPKQRGRPFKAGTSGNPRGRPKGSRNKRTRAVLEAAAAGGELPLDYMLGVMRDPTVSAKRRDEMAKAAAPYLHSRLSAVAHSGPADNADRPLDEKIVLEFVRAKAR
jgi:uncharacterized protein DUF5681